MEHLSFTYEGGDTERHDPIVVGVVSSGNLEVMIEADGRRVVPDHRRHARPRPSTTSGPRVLSDFVERAKPGGVRISINDVGATPAVVSLRLDQALRTFRGGAA